MLTDTSLERLGAADSAPRQVTAADGTVVTLASEMHIVERRRDSGRERRQKSPLARVFKTRSRRSIAVTDAVALEGSKQPRLSLLTQDNYQEKLGVLSQAKGQPVAGWKAGHVLAWLEVEANMPAYGAACAENIKSGKVVALPLPSLPPPDSAPL